MSDFLTVLKHPTSCMTKRWQADGAIKPYDDAKYFGHSVLPVSGISELSMALSSLETDPHACVIRGGYKGDDHAVGVDAEHKPGRVRRLSRLFTDTPHHWVLIEIDEYMPAFADPLLEPATAIDEYINDCLPEAFHGISYHWQLSNSAGHAKNAGKLKAHVWFWLAQPASSAQLKAWAESLQLNLDKAVFNVVQIHYTAAPLFDEGVANPVPLRSGFEHGLLGDEVHLDLTAVALPAATAASAAMPDNDDPFAGLDDNSIGLNLAEAENLLKYIDNSSYDLWLRAGMALHHEFAGSDDALVLWDSWSRSAANYAGFDNVRYRWQNFGSGSQHPVTARWLVKAGGESTRQAKNAEKHQALAEARDLIAECSDSVVLVNEVAKQAGSVAAGDIALRTELAGLIRSQFKKLTGTALSLPDVRVAMNAGRQAQTRQDNGRHELTEMGNVGRLVDRYGDDLMYIPQTDSWYTWNGFCWQAATHVELVQYATATVRALPEELKSITNEDERAKHREFCTYSQRVKMVEDMVRWAKSEDRILTHIGLLDCDMDVLGCANGAVDLTTGVLLAPDASRLITYSTGVEYAPDAICPVFKQTVLDAFFGDTEMAEYFQRVMGYIALGQPKESVIVIPHGSGNNGKSTIFKAIALALGNYAKTASAETFLSSGGGNNGGGAREDILRLRGARYVYSTEPEEGQELREGLIKAMTGGEALPARGLYSRHTIEVQPTWTVVMPTNHKPIIKGDDYGIWRRILLIPFTRNYDTDKSIVKDVNRPAKLLAELPGILRWIVEGAMAYRKQGLGHPESVKKAKEDYKSEMDLLRDWLEACCVEGPDNVVSNDALFASWEAYARVKGELKLIPTQRHLTRRVASKGYKKIKDSHGIRGRGFLGVGLIAGLDFCDISDKENQK